jgi:hypothetical protein
VGVFPFPPAAFGDRERVALAEGAAPFAAATRASTAIAASRPAEAAVRSADARGARAGVPSRRWLRGARDASRSGCRIRRKISARKPFSRKPRANRRGRQRSHAGFHDTPPVRDATPRPVPLRSFSPRRAT